MKHHFRVIPSEVEESLNHSDQEEIRDVSLRST